MAADNPAQGIEPGHHIRVVLADDVADLRWLMASLLATSGHFEVVGEAANGTEAIRAAERQQPDLVLLDVAMPGISGLQSLPEIRRVSPRSMVIVLSVLDGSRMVERAIALGATACLDKTSRPGDLIEALCGLCGVPRPQPPGRIAADAWAWRTLQQAQRAFLGSLEGAFIERPDGRRRETAHRHEPHDGHRYREMLGALGEGVALVSADGTVDALNEAMAELFLPGAHTDGLPGAAALAGLAVFDEDGVALSAEQHPTVVARATGRVEYRVVGTVRPDGSQLWAAITASPLVERGAAPPFDVVVTAKDVTAERAAQHALIEAEGRFRLAFENAPIGMALIGLDGSFLSVNRALCEILGRTPSELADQSLSDITHPEDRDDDPEMIRRVMALSTHYEVEKRFVHKDGSPTWILFNLSGVRGADGTAVHLVGQFVDVTERKKAEGRLSHQALHDELTGLPNRALFLDRLNQALLRSERTGSNVTVLFFDLDNFKVVNDSLGHAAGDRLLVDVARRLEGAMRPSDSVARFGGDEFTAFCEDASGTGDGSAIADRFSAALLSPFELDGRRVTLTASIGITAGSGAGAHPEALVRDADTAMYRAKERGKDRWEIFDHELRTRAVARLELEGGLRHALDAGELVLHYQPEIDLTSGGIVGVEALLRWDHPQRGLVAPFEIISLAEETGLIIPIGEWVLAAAVNQAERWASDFPEHRLTVGVNISAKQLEDPALLPLIGSAVERLAATSTLLCLELTETVFLHATTSAGRTLRAFHDLGAKIALDDFGTGYSSLAYLHSLPVDILKLDRAFVSRLGQTSDGDAIVSAIIDLAHALSLVALAEGVDTEHQPDILRGLGCDEAQGFLFSRPLAAPDLTELLAAGRTYAGSLPVRAEPRSGPRRRG